MLFIKMHSKTFILSIVLMSATTLAMINEVEAINNFGPKKRIINEFVPESAALPVGEKLVYKVNWWGLPIGYGEIQINQLDNGEKGYQIKAVARANDFLNSFYPIKDTITSKMGEDGYTIYFEKDIQEGEYRANEVTTFNYDQKKAYYESITNGSKKEIEIDGFLHDVLTAFYWVRMQPMKVGKALSTRIYSSEKTWDFSTRVKEIKQFSLPGQESQEVAVLIPKAKFKGILVDRGRVWIYVSSDERRVPLLIRLNTPYGPVTGVLEDSSI